MRTRIVVADRTEARIYDAAGVDTGLHLVDELFDPQGRLHDKDFKSDRPGRVFDRAATGTRRGSTAHHSVGGENLPHKHEAETFARRIADVLTSAYQDHRYERLVLIAPPEFLGVLRAVLPKNVSAAVICEVNKDLVHADENAIGTHLPREVFASI